LVSVSWSNQRAAGGNLFNSGQTALTIIELEISGGDRADFSLSHDFTLPVTLAPVAAWPSILTLPRLPVETWLTRRPVEN
jgi:hypothetical protein